MTKKKTRKNSKHLVLSSRWVFDEDLRLVMNEIIQNTFIGLAFVDISIFTKEQFAYEHIQFYIVGSQRVYVVYSLFSTFVFFIEIKLDL